MRSDKPLSFFRPAVSRVLPRWMADGAGTWWRHQWLSSGLLSLAVHVVLIAAATFTLGSTERTAGEGDDLVFIEGIPVTLVESVPSLPSLASDGEADADEPPEESVEPPEPPTEAEPEPVDPPPDEAEPPEPAPLDTEPPVPDEPTDPPDPDEPAPADAAEPEAEPDVDPTVMPAPPQPRARPPRPTPPVETAARAVEPPWEPPAAKKPRPPKRASAPSDAGAASSGAGGGGQGLGQGDPQASRYRSQVAAKLMANRFYPNGARRDRLEGTATVAFMIDRRGRAGDIAVVRSSGSEILDEAARSMVRRAEPFPPPPASLGDSVAIRAPLRFEMPR